MLQTATIAATISTVVSVDAVLVDWSLAAAAAARAAAAKGGDIAAEGAAGFSRCSFGRLVSRSSSKSSSSERG